MPKKDLGYRFGQRRLKKAVPVKIISKKRNKRRTRNVIINRGPSLIPDMYMTKMKFTKVIRNTTQMTLQGGVAQATDPNAVYTAIFSGNSIYDADLKNPATTWPIGYAEFRSFYERFYVRGSRISIVATAVGGDLTNGYRTFILPSNRNSIDGIPFNSVSGNPYATRVKYYGPAFGENITRAGTKMTTASITGRGKPVREQAFHGKMSGDAVSGNPEIEWYYHVVTQGTNAQFPQADIEITVQITYDVMFYQRRQQIQDQAEVSNFTLDEDLIEENSGPPNGPP